MVQVSVIRENVLHVCPLEKKYLEMYYRSKIKKKKNLVWEGAIFVQKRWEWAWEQITCKSKTKQELFRIRNSKNARNNLGGLWL